MMRVSSIARRLDSNQQSLERKRQRAFHPSPEGLEDRHLLAPVLPRGFVAVTIAQGFKAPSSFAVAPNHRIFVAEQRGAVRVIQNGHLRAKPVLKVPVNTFNLEGLGGIAVDPNFSVNHYIYIY